MNERQVAQVLKTHFQSKGWVVILEFQVTERGGTIAFPGYTTQRRPDLLLIDPSEHIVAIEVENEPFVQHPEVFRSISNLTYLAFPSAALEMGHIKRQFTREYRRAKDGGIGLLSVSRDDVRCMLTPVQRSLPQQLKTELLRLTEQRLKQDLSRQIIRFYRTAFSKSEKSWIEACRLLKNGQESSFIEKGQQALQLALRARYAKLLRSIPSEHLSTGELYDSLKAYGSSLKSRPQWLPRERQMKSLTNGHESDHKMIFIALEDSLKRLGVPLIFAKVFSQNIVVMSK